MEKIILRENIEKLDLIFLRCYIWWGLVDLIIWVRFKEVFDIFICKWNVYYI